MNLISKFPSLSTYTCCETRQAAETCQANQAERAAQASVAGSPRVWWLKTPIKSVRVSLVQNLMLLQEVASNWMSQEVLQKLDEPRSVSEIA